MKVVRVFVGVCLVMCSRCVLYWLVLVVLVSSSGLELVIIRCWLVSGRLFLVNVCRLLVLVMLGRV